MAAEEVAAEVEDGARAEIRPARAGALHPLLDEVLGRGFHGTRANWQVSFAEGRVLHPRRVGAEVIALSLQDFTRSGGSWLGCIEPFQHGFRPSLPEMIEGAVRPGLRLGCVIAV